MTKSTQSADKAEKVPPDLHDSFFPAHPFYEDLYQAYYDARLHKRNTNNQLRFEINLEDNLAALYYDIMHRQYQLSPGIAFIVEKPKMREVFAATFRDRVVHHLVYNFIGGYWDKRFIYDSYSCRVGKGTHFGISRVAHFMRAASHDYRDPAWVMKCDISGYFMHIQQPLIWEMVRAGIDDPDFSHPDAVKDLLKYLLPIIIFSDPTYMVNFRSPASKWEQLPPDKSLFNIPKGQGFPIGNLTSQLFSNIYLNKLDQFAKRELGVRYYGRYVDDFVMVDPDKDFLLYCRDRINAFLQRELQLELHPHKHYFQPVSHGVDFIGARIRPDGIRPGKRLDKNFTEFLYATAQIDHTLDWERQFNSYLGHYYSYQNLEY